MTLQTGKNLNTELWSDRPVISSFIGFVAILDRQFKRVKITGLLTEQEAAVYDDDAFEQLFKAHFKSLHAYATVMLKDEDMAEEVVQNMFLKLWEKRTQLNIQTSVKAFLYKCVHNDSLNYIKHQKIVFKYQDYTSYKMKDQFEPASDKLEFSELELRLKQALNELPQQCRTIFQMSRFEELKYKEIADQLGLSIKTVENQMGKALKILRLKLVDFLPLMVFVFLQNRNLFN